ncbi:post-GPI attachment to proteins factor 3 [Prorops nasuta]|uniref:post-GPI attachment to proteins factor 3 n=1 Tax=Prorops nasuta TaxID=863751 RepID=UPI0034CF1712
MQNPVWILLMFLSLFITFCFGSIGDRSQFYNQCLYTCIRRNCINEGNFKTSPSIILLLLQWSCKDDCSYNCMWKTVDIYINNGLEIPQFYGKWPFVRILGFQEPASTIFSILNFYSHWIMFKKFRKEIRSSYPMFYNYSYFSIVCLNGWIWSAIFHARDKQFTEIMDYSSAFAMVLTLLYCLFIRLTYKSKKLFVVLTCIYISILYIHLSHLWSGQINYGYNMTFNILIGFLTFAVTIVWWYYSKKKLPHVHYIGWFTVLSVLVTLLEVADFPPFLWLLDAHSLWHASTIPLITLLYQFMIQDCTYLRALEKRNYI